MCNEWRDIETAPKESHVILKQGKHSFIGCWVEIPFREFRDVDGFYTGQQDEDSYWMDLEDGERVEPDGWHPLPTTPPAEEQQ